MSRCMHPGVVLDSTSQREAKRRQFIRNPKGLPLVFWDSKGCNNFSRTLVFLLHSCHYIEETLRTRLLLSEDNVSNKQTGPSFVVSKTTPGPSRIPPRSRVLFLATEAWRNLVRLVLSSTLHTTAGRILVRPHCSSLTSRSNIPLHLLSRCDGHGA